MVMKADIFLFSGCAEIYLFLLVFDFKLVN